MHPHRTQPAADAFTEVAAWRPPEARRFDPVPANDWRAEVERAARAAEDEAGDEEMEIDWGAVARWAVPAVGGLVAALAGAWAGGWLQVL